MEISTFGVEEWLNKWEKSAKYDLAQSTIAALDSSELKQLVSDSKDFDYSIENMRFDYGWIEGSLTFKNEVAKLYKNINFENVLQTNGATGANYLALYGLLEPGDQVIAEYPSYQQLYDIPKSLGAKVQYWHIKESQAWYPDLDELKELVNHNTKMICLNNANNPTGTILDKNFLKKVVEIAKTVNAYVLVDEVYQPFNDNLEFISIVDLYDRGIATNSLSKTYSMPGIRVGWIVSNVEVINNLKKYRDYTMISAGVYNDAMAVHVLKNKASILARNKKIVITNLNYYRQWLKQESRVTAVLPSGVSTSFPSFDIPISTEKFCQNLLAETGVLLVPGEAFDLPGHVRLGYCTDFETLKIGLAKISKFLKQYD